MKQFSLVFTLPVFLAVSVALGCGSGRQLQSVTLSPAAGDAQDFPNSQVQFSATGTFSGVPSPEPLTSKDVTWCVGSSTGMCAGNINRGATVDQNGLAQCVPGFAGTATILAGKATTTAVIPDEGVQLTLFGAAQLTCP